MKRTFLKSSAVLLCLLMCLQFILGAGLFTLSASAVSFNIPTQPNSSTFARSKTDLAHGNSIYCYTGVSDTSFTSYVQTLKNSGYTQVASHNIGLVQTYTFSHAAGAAYAVYSGNEKTMYLALDDHSVTSSWSTKTSYTTVTDPALAIMTQDRSRTPLTDGNGMSQIFILADGSFLILDGGYSQDSERLYNFLLDNNKRTDGKIIIHAWYLSHGHKDHIGAFQEFAKTHGADVELENVIAYAAAANDPLTTELTSYTPYFGKDVKVIRPHTGDVYQMPGLTMEILYTGDDLYMYNETIDNGNNMSTVCKVTVGGQTILYTADAMDAACAKLLKMYPTTTTGGTPLKSTFFQLNHHGNSGGTEDFYTAVDPTYVIFTSSQAGMELRTNNKMYQWIASAVVTPQYNLAQKVGSQNIFAQDGPVEIITFPYDGNRDALPLYLVDDTVRPKDASVPFVLDMSSYLNPGHYYSASELATATGWSVTSEAKTGVQYSITDDGKLRIQLPYQSPSSNFDATTGVGTPVQNGEVFLQFSKNLQHFTEGRTVVEYELTYQESILPADFGAAFRIANSNITGNYWLEIMTQANGIVENRYRYNTEWQFLSEDVAATAIPYNNLITDYSTNSSVQYPGYIVSNGYANFKDSNGDGIYENTLTKQDTALFGSTNRYKMVIDPEDGVDVYVNDILISSTRVDEAWSNTVYEKIIGTEFGLRVMPGVDVTLGDVKVYREDKAPALVITEIAPKGFCSADEGKANTPMGYFEVYNNSDARINIYDYSIIRDSSANRDGDLYEMNFYQILPGTTTWVAANNSANTVTHTNPVRDEGWLEPGECALLWVPHNTMYNVTTTKEGNGNTVQTFRETVGVKDSTKVFVIYNRQNRPMATSGYNMYAVGYANVDYTSTYKNAKYLYGNFESYVYYTSGTITYTAAGSEQFSQTVPITLHADNNGSVRYIYANNNEGRRGSLYLAEAGVMTPGVVEAAQRRAQYVTVTLNGEETRVPSLLDLTEYLSSPDVIKLVRLTDTLGGVQETSDTVVHVSEGMKVDIYEGEEGKSYLYREDFSDYTAVSYVDTDVDMEGTLTNGYYPTVNATGDVKMKDLLKWKSITGTDGAEYEITSDGKLRLYNPYYAVSQRKTTTSYTTPNYDLQIEIGTFPAMVDRKVVLEYDFQYNDRGAAGTSAASFTLGRFVDRSSYGFSPVMTAQGFYRAQIGSKAGGSIITDQIRPEWIPYSKKTTGFNFTYGGVTNHYNIFGGTNHVKVEIDPYNGMMVSVNGVMISMVQDTANWESLYAQHMGELLGLTVTGGMEVVLDNIELYTVRDIRPDLLITEVGNAMDKYEYIEVYNNSDHVLDIYDYQLMRETSLGTIGTSWGNPNRWTTANIGTIKRGTHTYTASGSTQSVTLTNPEDGSIAPGQTAILWIPSNTTYVNGTSPQEEETLAMFMNNYGLTDASKIFATYNNDNLALYDGSNLAYGIGYANVDYTTHNAYALNELESYVYVNTTKETIFGVNVGITAQAGTLSSIEYQYNHNNGVKQGTFLSSVMGEKTPGKALDVQKRKVIEVYGDNRYEVNLGETVDLSTQFYSISLNTLPGASIRTISPTGMRWVTAVNAADYAMVQEWLASGLVSQIEIGTIIIHTEDLAGQDLTLDLVNGVDCFAVKATDTAWYEENPTVEAGYDESLVGTHLFAGSVANIKEANYRVKYSAVGYLSITVTDGSVLTIYGGYNEADHSRTVAEVAHQALNDPNSGLSTAEREVVAGFAAFYEE